MRGLGARLGADPGGRDVGLASVNENGAPVAFDEPFWFAVAAFRPGMKIVRKPI